MTTHAEAIAKVLVECGVEFVFGVPGGEILAFIDACRRAGLRFLLTGHESSAATMAQVVGQIRGVPGVCVSTLGPGATNLVTGVANAFLDRTPLLVFTAQIPGAAFGVMSHQRVYLDRLFTPITKRSLTLGAADSREIIFRSMRLASAPRPGPVHLVLPSDVALQECALRRAKEEPVASRSTDENALSKIAARVNSSERPLVLIGLGAEPSAAASIRALVDRLQTPFLVTPKVKGILPEEDPRFLGVASGMAIDRDIVETIRAADLVVAIGFDPVECDKTWFADVEIVALDAVTMSEANYRPMEAIGDLVALVAALTFVVEPKPWPEELLSRRREAIARAPTAAPRGLSPLRLIEELRSTFPRDGLVTCDVGSHKLLMGQFWRTYQPGTFFMSNGLSGMGFGIPAAVGAQLAYPDRPVLAVVGDGGMLMMLHDLELIRELGLPIIIVVFSDSSLSLIRVSQQRRGLPTYGVDFPGPNFAAIAEAFGICGRRAESTGEVRMEVERALASRRPPGAGGPDRPERILRLSLAGAQNVYWIRRDG
jgi:acetolactate synthase-1/2/3 large subunit